MSIFSIFLVISIVNTASASAAPAPAPQPPERPRAFFVFGDSLVDNGNNNYLLTTARADSPPYGIDSFNRLPSGRFSNGLNIPDLISEKLGAPPTLPYLSPQLDGDNLLTGANFASAGVGILNDTGFQFVNIINIDQQLLYFEEYQRRLIGYIGLDEARKLVNNGLVLISLGGNDFVNNYFLAPVTARRLQFNLPDYTTFLVSEYKKILQRLYDLGSRRVLVTGTGPLGCVPGVAAFRSTDGTCAPEPQLAAELYNPKLIAMIKELNMELNTDVFVATNAINRQNDFLSNPLAFGFKEARMACCGQGPFNGVGLCTRFSFLCADRQNYVFWDAYHPTEQANRIIVDTIYNGTAEHMDPMNLQTIINMGFLY
ncbi:GDSL esterase/lipase At4g28780-like [Apium graveolens]|uniref:GDSL esterase/lipase At4g28780-like n=1 Tax=Apium graveolens TaxID=4045 RepID=UPI003D7B0D84